MKVVKDGRTYYTNSVGYDVPEELMKGYDLRKDQTIELIARKVTELQEQMKKTKLECIEMIRDMQEDLYNEYNVRLGSDVSDNITFSSFDGLTRVKLETKQLRTFNEKIKVARTQINRCITKWADGANSNLKTVVDQAFKIDKDGRFNYGAIISLTKLEIDDPDWKEAVGLIRESQDVLLSRQYFTVEKRTKMPPKAEYEMVDLNFSRM
jgi:hypothetical protein